jgi:DNA primase
LKDAGSDPVKRAGLVIDIVRSISIIPNSVIRAEYVKECSSLLNVDEAMLYHEINKLKTNEQEKAATRPQNEMQQATQSELTPQPLALGKYESEERNILQLLVRYGDNLMYYADEAKTQAVTVASYILYEIEQDGLFFHSKTHQQILDEYRMHMTDETFNPERFFLYHPDAGISQLTADLVTEKYTLSKLHSKVKKVETDSDRLIDLVPRVVFEFKNSLILDMIRQKLSELKAASEARNNTRVDEIMREMAELEGFKKQLSKTLGERIIIKI